MLTSLLDGPVGDAARMCALVTGPARVEKVPADPQLLRQFDAVLACIAPDDPAVLDAALQYVGDEREWLQDHLVGVLCCAAEREVAEHAFATFLETVEKNSTFTIIVPFPPPAENVVSFARKIKRKIKKMGEQAPREVLKEELENFLKSHNTCTLCTAYDHWVRGTPIEYFLLGEYMYFFSEGGEKFANILLNPAVAVAIYDAYQGMTNLSGAQLTGKAEIIPPESEEYQTVVRTRKLARQLGQLKFNMNLIRVKIAQAEFLYSKFEQTGYDVLQCYDF